MPRACRLASGVALPMKCVVLTKTLFSVCLLLLIGGLIEHAFAQSVVMKEADALNEFDLASYCSDLQYGSPPGKTTEIRFGCTPLFNEPNGP
jgi:hypothetical protein